MAHLLHQAADEISMNEKRREARMLCAELVEIIWKDKSGRQRNRIANLEDISLSGACLQLEGPMALETSVTLRFDNVEMFGKVSYCLFRDFGYFVGVEFAPHSRWSNEHFRPKHLLDPRRLVHRSVRRAAQVRLAQARLAQDKTTTHVN